MVMTDFSSHDLTFCVIFPEKVNVGIFVNVVTIF